MPEYATEISEPRYSATATSYLRNRTVTSWLKTRDSKDLSKRFWHSYILTQRICNSNFLAQKLCHGNA